MPIDPLDLYVRLTKGERMSETKFDKLLVTRAREMVSKYAIKYDSGQIIPTDEVLIDVVWKAAYELALEVGFYCKDTARRILLSKEEIEVGLQEIPSDQLYLVDSLREIEDKTSLALMAGPGGAPVSEEIYLPLCISYAQEPGWSSFGTPSLTNYRGLVGKARTPAELLAIKHEVIWAKEALARVNKQNLYIAPAPQRALSMASILHMEGIALACIPFQPHLKIPMDNVLKYTLLHANGMLRGVVGTGYIGLHGGPEATLVIVLAEMLLGLGVAGALKEAYYHIGSIESLARGYDGAVSLWITALMTQICVQNGIRFYAVGELTRTGTSRTLVDVIIITILSLACGATGVAVGSTTDSCSGLDYRIGFETNMGMAGVTREEANDLIKSLLVYSRKQEVPAKAPKFEDCYNLETVQPTKEWTELYNKAKKEIQALGVRFKDARDFL